MTTLTWTSRGALGALFGFAATAVEDCDVASATCDWDCAMDVVLEVALSSMMVGRLSPTLFLALTLKSNDVSFFRPLISMEVVSAWLVPTCFHDFFPTSRRSTMYSVTFAPPSFSGGFHRSSLELSVFHSWLGLLGAEGLSENLKFMALGHYFSFK